MAQQQRRADGFELKDGDCVRLFNVHGWPLIAVDIDDGSWALVPVDPSAAQASFAGASSSKAGLLRVRLTPDAFLGFQSALTGERYLTIVPRGGQRYAFRVRTFGHQAHFTLEPPGPGTPASRRTAMLRTPSGPSRPPLATPGTETSDSSGDSWLESPLALLTRAARPDLDDDSSADSGQAVQSGSSEGGFPPALEFGGGMGHAATGQGAAWPQECPSVDGASWVVPAVLSSRTHPGLKERVYVALVADAGPPSDLMLGSAAFSMAARGMGDVHDDTRDGIEDMRGVPGVGRATHVRRRSSDAAQEARGLWHERGGERVSDASDAFEIREQLLSAVMALLDARLAEMGIATSAGRPDGSVASLPALLGSRGATRAEALPGFGTPGIEGGAGASSLSREGSAGLAEGLLEEALVRVSSISAWGEDTRRDGDGQSADADREEEESRPRFSRERGTAGDAGELVAAAREPHWEGTFLDFGQRLAYWVRARAHAVTGRAFAAWAEATWGSDTQGGAEGLEGERREGHDSVAVRGASGRGRERPSRGLAWEAHRESLIAWRLEGWVTRRALGLTRRAWDAWVSRREQAAPARAHLQATLRRCFVSRQPPTLHEIFVTWRDTLERRALHGQLLARAVLRMSQLRMRWALHHWALQVKRARVMGARLAAWVGAREARTASGVLHSWHALARVRAAGRAALTHSMASAARAARERTARDVLWQWRRWATERVRRRVTGERLQVKLDEALVRRTFGLWKAAAGATAAETRRGAAAGQLLAGALGRTSRALLRAAMHRWRDETQRTQALEFKCTSLVARRDWLRKRAVFRAWRGAAVETRVHAHRLASFVNARAHAVQSRAFGAWKALTARFAAARAALAVSVRAAAGAVSQASLLRASLVGWAEVANEGAQVAETTALRASRVLQNRRERRAFVAWRAEAVAAAQRRAAADEAAVARERRALVASILAWRGVAEAGAQGRARAEARAGCRAVAMQRACLVAWAEQRELGRERRAEAKRRGFEMFVRRNRRTCVAVLRAWAGEAADGQRRREAAEEVAERRLRRLAQSVFQAWAAVRRGAAEESPGASTTSGDYAAMAMTPARSTPWALLRRVWDRRLLRSALERWREVAGASPQQAALVQILRRRLERAVARRAMLAWGHVAWERSQIEAILAMFRQRVQLRATREAFGAWRDAADAWSDDEAMAAAGRLHARRKAKAMLWAWRGAAESARATAEGLAVWGARAWHRCAGRVLQAWRGAARDQRAEEERRGREALALAFAAWVLVARQGRLAKRAAVAVAASRERALVQKVFLAWQALVLADRSINAPEVQAGSLRVSDALRQWVAVARESKRRGTLSDSLFAVRTRLAHTSLLRACLAAWDALARARKAVRVRDVSRFRARVARLRVTAALRAWKAAAGNATATAGQEHREPADDVPGPSEDPGVGETAGGDHAATDALPSAAVGLSAPPDPAARRPSVTAPSPAGLVREVELPVAGLSGPSPPVDDCVRRLFDRGDSPVRDGPEPAEAASEAAQAVDAGQAVQVVHVSTGTHPTRPAGRFAVARAFEAWRGVAWQSRTNAALGLSPLPPALPAAGNDPSMSYLGNAPWNGVIDKQGGATGDVGHTETRGALSDSAWRGLDPRECPSDGTSAPLRDGHAAAMPLVGGGPAVSAGALTGLSEAVREILATGGRHATSGSGAGAADDRAAALLGRVLTEAIRAAFEGPGPMGRVAQGYAGMARPTTDTAQATSLQAAVSLGTSHPRPPPVPSAPPELRASAAVTGGSVGVAAGSSAAATGASPAAVGLGMDVPHRHASERPRMSQGPLPARPLRCPNGIAHARGLGWKPGDDWAEAGGREVPLSVSAEAALRAAHAVLAGAGVGPDSREEAGEGQHSMVGFDGDYAEGLASVDWGGVAPGVMEGSHRIAGHIGGSNAGQHAGSRRGAAGKWGAGQPVGRGAPKSEVAGEGWPGLQHVSLAERSPVRCGAAMAMRRALQAGAGAEGWPG